MTPKRTHSTLEPIGINVRKSSLLLRFVLVDCYLFPFFYIIYDHFISNEFGHVDAGW